jgi:beta-glucanase (GH16 family)
VHNSNFRAMAKRLFLPVFIVSNFILPLNAGWETQWIDSFDGAGINLNNWTPQIQANYNNEVQCYTDDDSSANRNYEISDGILKIIARRQSINCPGLGNAYRSWTSGRINSKDKQEFLYGRIESRIRFLNDEAGTWSAFWMLENRIAEDPKANDNDFVNWPNPGAGEIDVWEWFSNSPNTYITNFFNASSNCGSLFLYDYPNGGADVKQWHDYAIEWDANAIKFYIDDIMVKSHNITSCAQYKEPMFVLLNVAIGGSLGGNIDPALNLATMEVDYIAHCTVSNSNSANRCNEATPSANVVTNDLIIFDDVERSDWPAWDSDGGTNPLLLTDSDLLYAEAMQFTINGSTVVGFTSRMPEADNGVPYDASGIEAMGTFEFDLKMTTSPGVTDWKLKFESVGVATEAEVSLSSSIEGHASPLINVWQHYSFNLSVLAAMGLDLSNIDLVTIFPEYGSGDGAVYRIDNVKFRTNLPQAIPVITSVAISDVIINNLYTYTLKATDTDGDDLTLAAPVLPQWLSFNSTTGLLSGTPTTTDIGVHNVSLTVSDGNERVIQAFSITVLSPPNTTPSIISQADRFITAGGTYLYNLQVSDAEGDALTLSIISAPDWLTFNSALGLLSGVPTAENIGSYNVTVMASDRFNSTTQTFRITVRAAQANVETGFRSGGGSLSWWILLMVIAVGNQKLMSRWHKEF